MEGMGDMRRDELVGFFKQHRTSGPGSWKWMHKLIMKDYMSYYTALAESKNMPQTKERIQQYINSSQSVENVLKVFKFHDSKFKTMCHSDLRTAQVMFSLNEDGKCLKSLTSKGRKYALAIIYGVVNQGGKAWGT